MFEITSGTSCRGHHDQLTHTHTHTPCLYISCLPFHTPPPGCAQRRAPPPVCLRFQRKNLHTPCSIFPWFYTDFLFPICTNTKPLMSFIQSMKKKIFKQLKCWWYTLQFLFTFNAYTLRTDTSLNSVLTEKRRSVSQPWISPSRPSSSSPLVQ